MKVGSTIKLPKGRTVIVCDYNAYSVALHTVVSMPIQPWPMYHEVLDTYKEAIVGDYVSYEKLCLWYHKLPLPVTAMQRITCEQIRESYTKLKVMYQSGGKHCKSNSMKPKDEPETKH